MQMNRFGGEKFMYSNLRSEMARGNISNREMAKVLKLHENTVSNKLLGKSESGFSIEEAFLIKSAFFPDLDLSYLFQREDNPPKAG